MKNKFFFPRYPHLLVVVIEDCCQKGYLFSSFDWVWQLERDKVFPESHNSKGRCYSQACFVVDSHGLHYPRVYSIWYCDIPLNKSAGAVGNEQYTQMNYGLQTITYV